MTVTLAPGSGWAWSQMSRVEANGATEGPPIVATDVQVEGATAARQISYGADETMVIATDGTNIVRVATDIGDPLVATERVIAALGQDRS